MTVNASLEKWYSLFNSEVNKNLPLLQSEWKDLANLLGFHNSYWTLSNIETNYWRKHEERNLTRNGDCTKSVGTQRPIKLGQPRLISPELQSRTMKIILKSTGTILMPSLTERMYNSILLFRLRTMSWPPIPKAFNFAFVDIAQRYIDQSLQGTPDFEKLRSFVNKMKPTGELFNTTTDEKLLC